MPSRGEVVLVRHGETAWSRSGQHTSYTDLPLTDVGRRQATAVGEQLLGRRFSLVLSSPRRRALETAQLAGLPEPEVDHDLAEWDKGDYEGRTTAAIAEEEPGWTVWTGSVPGGETAEEVGRRVDRVLRRARAVTGGAGDGSGTGGGRGGGSGGGGVPGDVALVSHGHLLRVLAARWVDLAPLDGRRLALGTATLCVLGWEHGGPVIRVWNREA